LHALKAVEVPFIGLPRLRPSDVFNPAMSADMGDVPSQLDVDIIISPYQMCGDLNNLDCTKINASFYPRVSDIEPCRQMPLEASTMGKTTKQKAQATRLVKPRTALRNP